MIAYDILDYFGVEFGTFFLTYIAGILVTGFVLCILPNEQGEKFSIEETAGMAMMWWLVVIALIQAAFVSSKPIDEFFMIRPRNRANKTLRNRDPVFFEHYTKK